MRKQAFQRLSAILAAAMIIMAIAPMSVLAADQFDLDGLKYEITDTGQARIIGTADGAATPADVRVPFMVTHPVTNQQYDVVEIGRSAFINRDDLGSLDFSNASTLERIEDEAFRYSTIRGGVDLSGAKRLKYIGNHAFNQMYNSGQPGALNLSGLAELETIGEMAFCESNSCFSSAFFDPTQLPKLKKIGTKALWNCGGITNEVLNFATCTNLTEIGGQAFKENTKIKSVIFPAKITALYDRCFSECSSLSELHFVTATPPNLVQNNAMEAVFGGISPTGTLYCPQGSTLYNADHFKIGNVDPLRNWSFPNVPPVNPPTPPTPPTPTQPGVVITPVNENAEIPEADVFSFGREFSVSGEITGAPGVPESVKLNVSALSPEFTSNKAANAAYSDALLYGQPVAFSSLGLTDAANGQAYTLPEGAMVKLGFELGATFAGEVVTISHYDAAGALIERFNVTCDGSGAAVIETRGLGIFVITRAWI